jgi:quercetin dioxygenase-like cupin family protein
MSSINTIFKGAGEILQLGPIQARILEDGSRTDDRIGAVEITVPPKTAQTPQHLHRMHDETFLVTRGTVRFTFNGADHDLHVGDYVVVPTGASHTFSNPFDETAIFFNSFTPAYYVSYLRELATLSAKGGLSPEAILKVMARYATEPAGRSN